MQAKTTLTGASHYNIIVFLYSARDQKKQIMVNITILSHNIIFIEKKKKKIIYNITYLVHVIVSIFNLCAFTIYIYSPFLNG